MAEAIQTAATGATHPVTGIATDPVTGIATDTSAKTAGHSRKVLHIDCDCFFAAVEMRERPELASQPLAIGGESDRRGVIATCNYVAREYGVRSAMATATARRLCPDLVLLSGRMALYRSVSEALMAILREYSSVVEQVSVDEAYLELESGQ
ncbi:MAG: hypothetical protein CMK92_02980, partial [Pseudomonas sp.]|nr:hypothetical protein [Pseudomonas sp.]